MTRLCAVVGFLSLLGCQQQFTIQPDDYTQVVVDSTQIPPPIDNIDILFALDTSCSMAGHSQTTSAGILDLKNSLDPVSLDYNLEFITLDAGDLAPQGPFNKQTPSWTLQQTIDSLTPTMSSSRVVPGGAGEAGYSAVGSYLQQPDSFQREDTDLLVFIISDADEQSTWTSSEFLQFLQYQTANAALDVVNVTVPEAMPTGEYMCGEGPGTKYIELAGMLGKDPVDICANNWGDWRQQSPLLSDPPTVFYLSEIPEPSSIVVYKNQQILDGSLDWHYNSTSNSVQLSQMPDRGDLIEIGYDSQI